MEYKKICSFHRSQTQAKEHIMFYGQCWKCGERWELGTASSCKCPEELPAYTFKQPSEPVFAFLDTKPNHNMTFHNQDGKQVGVLDFNGPEMTFTGDADESAKVFFDFIARSFKGRLEQERADERNRTWTQEHWTEYEHGIRNATLDEIATKIDQMPFGDTAASFAVWIREQKI